MSEGTEISAGFNQGVMAGRDVFLGDQYVVQDTLYFEPSLQEVEPPAYASPPGAQALLRQLVQQRLLVLAGPGLEEKGRVARHIAWLLRAQMGRDSRQPLRVREWYRSSDPQKIETAFHPAEGTLLLLPQVQPHHLGYRLEDLIRFLHASEHYVVITTDSSIAQWRVQDLVDSGLAWCEPSWNSYYGTDFLVALLQERLAAADLSADSLGEVSPLEVVAGLKSPDRIDPFVRWLLEQDTPATHETLKGQIDFLVGETRRLDGWYRSLDPEDQILAIGLLFFEGLPDDQVFAGLETLVADAWRLSDPQLSQFDYGDLEKVAKCFGLADAGSDGMRIEMVSRELRRELIRTVWKHQRRRVLATLPALTAMIKRSASQDEKETEAEAASLASLALGKMKGRLPAKTPEVARSTESALASMRERSLYNSGPRARRFRDAMIETLAEVGLISLESIEPYLLELIVQGPPVVRKLVAKTVASWRAADRGGDLFNLLEEWCAEGCESESSREWISALAKKGSDPFVEIRSTVALAVGYGVQYDPPNQLSPQLIHLLEVLLRDRFPKVRNNILELTLPMALAWHLRQLEDWLRTNVELDDRSMHAVAFGMAMAVSIDPEETVALLDRWLAERQSAPPQSGPAPSERERWIGTLALAYGYIQTDVDDPVLPPEQILNKLQAIFSEERHPFVRRQVILAFGLQSIRHFALVSPMLDQLASTVTLEDRGFFLAILRQAYLYQREQMEGGDSRILIEDRSYAVWTQSDRPSTALEILLFEWIEDGDPVARQLAVEAFVELQATELDRSERSLSAQGRGAVPTAGRIRKEKRLRGLGPLGYLAVFLTAPQDGRKRAALRPMLAELLALQKRRFLKSREVELRPEAFGDGDPAGRLRNRIQSRARARQLGMAESLRLLGRWAGHPGHEVRELVTALGRTLVLYRLRWVLILAVVFAGAQLRTFGGDMAANYAFWLYDLPYQSSVERQVQRLADRIVGVEPEHIEMYS